MAYKLMNLAKFIQTLEKKQICALDTEGAPSNVSQASLVNGNNNPVINTYITNGKLPGSVGHILDSTLKQNKLLVGFSIKGDIKALQKLGHNVPSDSVVVDLYLTFMNMLDNNMIKKPPERHDLSSVAKAHGIARICGYHNSLVDASITMKLFWEMAKRTKGKFIVIQGNVDGKPIHEVAELDMSMIDMLASQEEDLLSQTATLEPETKQIAETSTVPERKDENVETPMNLKYDAQQNESVYLVAKHLYEAIIDIQGQKELIRLTDKELKLYNRICRQTPNYPLWMFYQTIIAPGALNRKEISMEKEQAKKKKEMIPKEEKEAVIMGPLV